MRKGDTLNKVNDASPETLSISNVIRVTGSTLGQLYHWEKLGLIHPQYIKFGLRLFRKYGRRDIELINKIIFYLKKGYKLQIAGQKAVYES